MTANVFVTGATGFIGRSLVKRLLEAGHKVHCLARAVATRVHDLPPASQWMEGDIEDAASTGRAVHEAKPDVVFHLAGLTKAFHRDRFQTVNVLGTRHVLDACSRLPKPPVVVVVSSLAAAGPSTFQTPRRESEPAQPVSAYGRSKHSAEMVAAEFANKLPISMVRPPIVLGPHDHDGFSLFKTIWQFGIHVVPSYHDHRVSVIHVADLVEALIAVWQTGYRLGQTTQPAAGIYFAADRTQLTYAELGQRVSVALGRQRLFVLRHPQPLLWPSAAAAELVARLIRKPFILSWDKAKEAVAGSWTCDSTKLMHETNWQISAPIEQRLAETAAWYFEAGWLHK